MKDIKDIEVTFTAVEAEEKKREEENIILTLTKTESELVLLAVNKYTAMVENIPSSMISLSMKEEFIEDCIGLKEKIETSFKFFKAKDIILALTRSQWECIFSIVEELKELCNKEVSPDRKETIEMLNRIEDEIAVSFALYELKCTLMENNPRK